MATIEVTFSEDRTQPKQLQACTQFSFLSAHSTSQTLSDQKRKQKDSL